MGRRTKTGEPYTLKKSFKTYGDLDDYFIRKKITFRWGKS